MQRHPKTRGRPFFFETNFGKLPKVERKRPVWPDVLKHVALKWAWFNFFNQTWYSPTKKLKGGNPKKWIIVIIVGLLRAVFKIIDWQLRSSSFSRRYEMFLGSTIEDGELAPWKCSDLIKQDQISKETSYHHKPQSVAKGDMFKAFSNLCCYLYYLCIYIYICVFHEF